MRALGLNHGPFHAELRLTSGARGCWKWRRVLSAACVEGAALRGRHAARRIGAAARDRGRYLRIGTDGRGVRRNDDSDSRGGVYEDAGGMEEARAVEGIDDVIVTAKAGPDADAAAGGRHIPGLHLRARQTCRGSGGGAAAGAREIQFPDRDRASNLYAVAHALAGPPAEPLVQMCDPAWGIAENTIGGRAPGKQRGDF